MRTTCSQRAHERRDYKADQRTLTFVAGDLDLRGVWVPLITPFAADGSVDVAAIERLCTEYLDAGVTGIVALGTTGEPAGARRSGEARGRRHVRSQSARHAVRR